MKYVYRMSRKMFLETLADAKGCGMCITQYITKNFGIIGECIKVEII